MKTLFEDSKGELIKNNKLMNLSTIIHFGAELSYLPAMLIPAVGLIGWGENNINDLAVGLGSAVALNVLCQPIAFYLKARSMTSEGNYQLALKFAKDYKENLRKDRKITAFLDRKLIDLHWYFARKYRGERC